MTGLMKLIASVLIIVGVSLGALGAATTYLAPLSLSDETLTGLRLSAPAGIDEDGDPLYPSGTTLDPEIVQALKDNNVTHVSISSFSLATWDKRYMAMFVGSCVLLVAGGVMLRIESKQRVAKADASETEVSPTHTIAALTAAVESLRAELDTLPTEQDRLRAIITQLNDAQRTYVTAFVDARERLIGRYGLGRFAMIMDRFAASERAINRAWSAAADEVYHEAEASLADASLRLAETSEMLK
jgi:hypothetical protein